MAYTSSQVVQAVPTGINSALVFISKTVVTATTQQNLTNVFSATYDHYLVRWSNLVAPNDLRMRYGTSGTPDTAATYSASASDIASNTLSAVTQFNGTSHAVNQGNETEGAGCSIEISSPFLTVDTTYSATASAKTGSYLNSAFYSGLKNTATSYTDLVFISVANFSGTVYIYGYTNS